MVDLRSRPTTDENVQYVTLLPGKSGRKLILTGMMFEASANNDTHHDYQLSETRELQGAMLQASDHQPGDYIELSVRGVVQEGGEEIEVGKFAETIFVPPDGKIDQIVSESTVSFPAGFKIRITYHAVDAGEARSVYATLRMRH